MNPPSTLLVVENDSDVTAVIREALVEVYVNVVSAPDGEHAMSFLQTNELPSLILLDFQMPNMNGFEFRALQLKDPRLRGVPVVFMTGVQEIPPQRDAQDQISCLKKPFTEEELLAVVRRFIA